MNDALQKSGSEQRRRPLSRRRIVLALAIAATADGMQLMLAAAGWVGLDQAIDVVTMTMLIPIIGFHWLLLPSFVLELVPVLEDFPTWTGCVLAVTAIRKYKHNTTKSIQ